MKYASIENILH